MPQFRKILVQRLVAQCANFSCQTSKIQRVLGDFDALPHQPIWVIMPEVISPDAFAILSGLGLIESDLWDSVHLGDVRRDYFVRQLQVQCSARSSPIELADTFTRPLKETLEYSSNPKIGFSANTDRARHAGRTALGAIDRWVAIGISTGRRPDIAFHLDRARRCIYRNRCHWNAFCRAGEPSVWH